MFTSKPTSVYKTPTEVIILYNIKEKHKCDFLYVSMYYP